MHLSEAEAKALGIDVPPRKSTKQGRQDAQKRKPAKPALNDNQALFDAMCEANGLPVPTHQFRFKEDRKWAFDYLFGGWLAVEKVGGVWIGGHHSGGQDQLDDMERRNEAQLLGYVVLEFSPQQFDNGEAFKTIKRAMDGEGG